MYIEYANAPHDRPAGYSDASCPVLVNSCGTYRLESHRAMPTHRPTGRCDYQLIYVAAGRGFYYLDGTEPAVATAGSLVLYRPGEEQKYIYYGADRPHIYWVHFTGRDIEAILARYGLSAGPVFAVGADTAFAAVFDRIITELQLGKPFCADRAALLLLWLVTAAGRARKEAALFGQNSTAAEIERAKVYFREHFREPVNVERYAEANGMSASWFFRRFKEDTGASPLQYILGLRLKNAQTLLELTDCSVGEVAAAVGYDNALYFSRLFRRHLGLSPREYRRIHGTAGPH